MSTERQQQAKEYARQQHRLLALDLILGACALVAFIALGWNVWLAQTILALTPNVWFATVAYFLVGALGYEALFAPLAYYGGFVLPRRYGLSTLTLRAWLLDAAKGGVLGIVLGGIVIEAIYFVLRAAPDTWWWWATGFMILFNVVLANLAPVLIAPLFYKFVPLADGELTRRLYALAEQAHTRVQGVYTILLSEKTTTANAALMGLGNTRRIVLGDTLYQNYSPDEIETILAHELGHHVHRDIGWSLVFESATTLAGFFLADVFLRASVTWLGYAGVADLAAMPLFALALGAFGLVTTPASNAFSRWREYLADEYALRVTRNASAFIRAMEKLAHQNLADPTPSWWVEWLLYSHPPIGKRIEHAARRQANFASP